MTIHRWALRAALVACALAVVVPGSAEAARACPIDSGDAWTHGVPSHRGRTTQPVTEFSGVVAAPTGPAVAVDASCPDLVPSGRPGGP